ncbi:MAG: hypothetical protein GX558_06350 [Clostridiales bacterium]|nr:hypothetical protein [Clostridiales bacterium]
MRLRRAIAWLMLAAALGAAVPLASSLASTLLSGGRAADARRQALIRREGFVGVLRMWTCEGFSPGAGSLSGWVMACIRRFERQHPGVYVQMRQVSPGVMAQFGAGDLNPPDVILFGRGMLESAAHLVPLEDLPMRAELADAGAVDGVRYAAPVAMGGAAWALNGALLKALPERWAGLERPVVGKKPIALMAAPADGAFSMSAALIALSVQPQSGGGPPPKAGEGVDLGLPIATAEPTPKPARKLVSLGLPDELPDGFRAKSSAYEDFVAGRAAALPVTQREITRLMRLAESGRMTDVTYWPAGAALTDQLAMMAVVDAPKDGAQARQALCAQLIALMLDDASQRALAASGALPVVDGLTLYAGTPGMAQIEATLSGELWVPNAFDAGWKARAAAIADRFQAGAIDAVEALEELKQSPTQP